MISAIRFMIPLCLAQAGAILCAAEPEPLTDITKIRALSREETAQALPEKLPISEILNPQTRSVYEMVTAPGHPDCNGRLIQMEGVLRRVLPPDKEGNSTAVIETEDQLAAEISSRESARLEFDTVTRERQRLANDLHDTLEQNLTGLALQLEIANRIGSSNPTQSGHHLTLARQFLERSRTETHRTVWDLRSEARDGRGFLNILEERVSAMVAGTGITVTWKHEGVPAPLPDLVAGNLLLLALEAVTNALKHSGAAEIKILLRQTLEHAELVIEDDGCGFDVAMAPGQRDGHFGLQGMRERTKRLGGEIELFTAPGNGTTLRVKVPLLSPAPGEARHIQT